MRKGDFYVIPHGASDTPTKRAGKRFTVVDAPAGDVDFAARRAAAAFAAIMKPGTKRVRVVVTSLDDPGDPDAIRTVMG